MTGSADVAAGRIAVFIAGVAEGAVGTAQLRLNEMPNGLHRAEVAKVLGRRDARRPGVARTPMMPDGTLAPTTYFFKELA